jgi:hypothetical protein
VSPGILQCLKYKKSSPDHDPFKSDVFSLGISILCLCTLDRFERFYDYYNYTIDYNYALSNFRRMKRIGYSD